MSDARGRFVCPRCSKRLGSKVVCSGVICGRCTGLCRVEQLDETGQLLHNPAIRKLAFPMKVPKFSEFVR